MTHGRDEVVLESRGPLGFRARGALTPEALVKAPADQRRRADEQQAEQDGGDEDTFAGEARPVLAPPVQLEQLTLVDLQFEGLTPEILHDLAPRSVGKCGRCSEMLTPLYEVNRLLHLVELIAGKLRQVTDRVSRGRLAAAQTTQLGQGEADLRDGRVILVEVGRVLG